MNISNRVVQISPIPAQIGFQKTGIGSPAIHQNKRAWFEKELDSQNIRRHRHSCFAVKRETVYLLCSSKLGRTIEIDKVGGYVGQLGIHACNSIVVGQDINGAARNRGECLKL